MVVVRSVGATSGLPYLAKSMLKLSPTSAWSVIPCSTARILSWSRTSLGKCTVMGLVPALLGCPAAPLPRLRLADSMDCELALRRVPPAASTSVSDKSALLILYFSTFILRHKTTYILIYLSNFLSSFAARLVFERRKTPHARITESGAMAKGR